MWMEREKKEISNEDDDILLKDPNLYNICVASGDGTERAKRNHTKSFVQNAN